MEAACQMQHCADAVTSDAMTEERATMQMATPDSRPVYAEFMERIKALYPELTPQFQAGAKYLLDHPDEIAVSSMRTIARNANVQSSTLVRLAQYLGFQGWPELKAIFVERVRSVPEGYAKKADSITRQKESGSLIAQVFEAQRLNLGVTEARNQAALLAAAKLIEKVKQVHIAGFRASYPIAFSFQYLYRLFRPSVQLINAHAGTLEMGLRAISKEDAVVVISFAPYSSEALTVVREARKIGCKLLAITDSDVAPVALEANQSIIIAVESPSFFPSIVAGIAAIESLVELLVSRGGPAAVKQLEMAEKQLFEAGAYHSPPRS
jgi:DNA-binding MurR/RpiR family transcriptional regulator